jgi:hypothetical protein
MSPSYKSVETVGNDEIKFNTEIIINGLPVGASYLFITPSSHPMERTTNLTILFS